MAKHQYPAWLNEFALQCPHKHFNNKVVDRDFLTRKQHLDLLCTPRGYRWEVADEISNDKNQQKYDQCPRSKPRHPKAHVYNILAELWSLVTPEMIERMKTMLTEEFGIPEDQAVDFMCKKIQETMFFASPRAHTDQSELEDSDPTVPKEYNQPRLIQLDLEKPQRPCKPSLSIKPAHVKMFSNAVSKKLAELLTTSICVKRTKKHKLMANCILKSLCQITGDHCTMDNANTILQKAQTLFADKFALWILRNVKDEDAQRERRRAFEDAAVKRKYHAKLKEKQQREKARIRLSKKLELQKKVLEKITSEQKSGEEEKKKRRQQEREEKYTEWKKRDEENQKQAEKNRKEQADKRKQERQQKEKKDAEMKEQIAKDNAARKKKREEMLVRLRMEEKRQEKAKKRDSLKKVKR